MLIPAGKNRAAEYRPGSARRTANKLAKTARPSFMSHSLLFQAPEFAAPCSKIAASSKQTQLIVGPSLTVGAPSISRTVVIRADWPRFCFKLENKPDSP
jgi:hypothetical protein